MAVPFRFDAVLRVREAEREKCRLALAEELQREAAVTFSRDQLCAEQQAAIDELNALHARGQWSPEQESIRRAYCEQLATRCEQVEEALKETSTAVEARRAELLEAETAVKGLQKLADQHSSDQRRANQLAEDRESEDGWRAA
jgi:flagellar export protein FliJ